MNDPKTYDLSVPGATLRYDVRGELPSSHPVLTLIGSPMGASGFATLASYFEDRTVVTYDPRGAERSEKDDPTSESTADQHADDLHRIISALDAGPVDLFASSGGAVNALALVAAHPEQVRTLVAHEPLLALLLPDRDQIVAVLQDLYDSYQRDGSGPAMAKFMALSMRKGPLPANVLDEPAPDPAAFGLPTEDDGSRDDVLLGQNIRTNPVYEPDLAALQAASTRIVVGAGAESEGELANRGAHALAERLGVDVVSFPRHHGGFLGPEFGWPGEPESFAATLRRVLD